MTLCETLTGWLLWAQVSPLQSMGRGFREKRSQFDMGDVVVGLMILGGFALGLWILSLVMHYQEKQKTPCNRPKRLFRALCKAHGLDFATRRLLQKLARQQQLPQPALLFLQPDCFNPDRLGELSHQRERVTQLRQRLFG